MTGSAQFKQLREMGIPGGRAKAALARSKNDVMAAAERVFAGEYDDIPSDDEGDDTPIASGSGSKTGNGRQLSVSSAVAAIEVTSDNGSGFEVMSEGEDEDGAMESMEEDDEEGGFGAFDESDDDDEANRTFSDPYAGIFYSKDRTETVIETAAKPEHLSLKLAGEAVDVRILGSGEWMSGCPEGNEQSHLFQLYNKLSAEPVPCSGLCGHEFQRRKQDFFALFPDFPQYLAYVTSIIRPSCPRCSHLTCLACGQRCDKPAPTFDAFPGSNASASADKGKGKGKAEDELKSVESGALLHCVDIQGAILGVGLFLIEETSSNRSSPRLSGSATATPPAKRQKRGIEQPSAAQQAAQDQEDDDDAEVDDYEGGMGISGARGTGKSFAAGTGYSGPSGARGEDLSGQVKAAKAQREADTKLSTLLSQVQVYLPTLNRASGSTTSDHMVHPTALAHLRRRSGFVGDLLRNDSLLDMSNRGELYRALFDWLEVVSNHEALASMLAMPSMRPTTSTPLPNHPNDFAVVYEGGASPRELLEYIVIQAKAAVEGLQATGTPADDEKTEMTEEEMRVSVEQHAKDEEAKRKARSEGENEILLDFCNRIIVSANTIDKRLAETKGRDFVKRMQDSLPKLPGMGEHSGDKVVADSGATGEAIIKIYEEWAMNTRFQYADLTEPNGPADKVTYRHAYNNFITALEGQSAPKRSLAIAKELAILTTSLPVAWHSSIFLRVDETRVDCIKAMIIGPEGTPYENGCFIFDIFLPLEYNLKSPDVKSMTTYGGRYRYNPNLYADGKVCLSLLGTWSGPGWISGQSTLLQVLISIQSLIMNEEPYLNEPGWANGGGSAHSKAYSANIRRMVLVDAMGGNIRSPPYPFEDEIRTHFRLKASSIRDQLVKWAKIDDGRPVKAEQDMSDLGVGRTGSSFKDAAAALLALLDGLEGK